MASNGTRIISVNTSPKGGDIGGDHAAANSPPKGQCVCSPTTHQGSFRCRFHRSSSSPTPPPWFKQSKSMSNSDQHHVHATASLSHKSIEST